ncbi:advillin-like [Daphnia carinata]|uniref:advillin-like n=1 Tax=Daphnia carinata TaxID=120202 RepID=UPI00257C0B88|nr:advillin-like [Daphnia carinata]XP_059352736.1 advillin-like [Daphnia carinata]
MTTNHHNVVDPAFSVVPKESPAFLIWRVEDMKLVLLPKESYGKFHSGDSYLIYSAFESGQPCGTLLQQIKGQSNKLERYIHFWLGNETTQDEAGVVAIKAVELDDVLGGSPVQQREVEGSESARFMTYFKDGIRILPGGAASGFKHVTDEFHPALYSVKGKRNPIVRQLPEVSWSLMNEGDVFVLDCKKYIFVWVGRSANNKEKMHAAKLAQTLKGEHGESYSTLVIVEDGQELGLPDAERAALEGLLAIQHKKLKPVEAENDEAFESNTVAEIKLYRCTDEDGTLKVTEVKKGPLFQADLSSNDSFIVDNGANGIFVWVGKKATPQERTEAMRNGQGFAKKKEYPPNTNVTRVLDGGEPAEFRTLFRDWKVVGQTVGFGRQASVGKIAKVVQTKFDASTLHENPKAAAKAGMVDDGSGKKEVYRIINKELSPVPHAEHGKFYAGDCYVINYAYTVGGTEKNIIYYWLGSTAGQDEKGIAAVMAVDLDNKLGGRAVQVRVIQGKEPEHFLSMFGGKMVIYSGGRASGFESQQGEKDDVLGNTYMLQVRGNAAHNTKAIQVPLKASSLNSNDVFILMSPNVVYIWCGKGCTGDEREMAKKIAADGKGDSQIMVEGKEKAEFWEMLGGKGPYMTDMRTVEEIHEHEPRLFHCSNATGNMKVEEILDFNQTDLVEEDVMVLDAWHSIFIWVGVNSNKQEVALVEKGVVQYLRSDPKGRDLDTPILKVHQGCEPPTFTGFFGAWDPSSWENRVDFEKLKENLKKDNPNMTIALSVNGSSGEKHRYPLIVLQEKNPEKLPADVDPAQKELSLHDAEFTRAFKMERTAFEALPAWKRNQLKKDVGIF